MEKIEKLRKLCKIVQWAGIGVVVLAAVGMIFLQNRFADEQSSTVFMYSVVGVMTLFVAMTFVTLPIQNKLQKQVILESTTGLVTDLTFERKKGYSKESFTLLGLSPETFNQYGCADYYSFTYHNMTIESVTCKAYNETKIPKSVDAKGNKVKAHKDIATYFHGRLYIIPLKCDCKFNVLGKANPSYSHKKYATRTPMTNELPIKVKKQMENFEVFYGEEKPTINIQKFLDRLLTLKLQAKGPVHCFVRENNVILLIDNGRYYKEVEIKNPVSENLIKEYKRDLSMALSFINTISNADNELSEEIKG